MISPPASPPEALEEILDWAACLRGECLVMLAVRNDSRKCTTSSMRVGKVVGRHASEEVHDEVDYIHICRRVHHR